MATPQFSGQSSTAISFKVGENNEITQTQKSESAQLLEVVFFYEKQERKHPVLMWSIVSKIFNDFKPNKDYNKRNFRSQKGIT